MKGKNPARCAGFFDFIKTKNNSREKVLVKLFQKLAELETASRFNAKASAFAAALQNREAPLLDFRQSQYFPNVGKCSSGGFPKENGGGSRQDRVATCRRQVRALSPRAPAGAHLFYIEIYLIYKISA